MGKCLSKFIWGSFFFFLENEVAYQEPIEILSQKKKKKKTNWKIISIRHQNYPLKRENMWTQLLCYNFDVDDSKWSRKSDRFMKKWLTAYSFDKNCTF